MAEICRGVVTEKEQPSVSGASSSRAGADGNRRLKFVAGVRKDCKESSFNKPRVTISPASFSRKHDVDVRISPASNPKFGVASVCGRRREMEDTVSVRPSFIRVDDDQTSHTHYFGVFDGHGCSHVAKMCRNRLHLLVKEEEELKNEWKKTMERSFRRMDEEVILWDLEGCCRCEPIHGPESYGVGSTAVVAVVTPDKIIIANCGDSRAVLCRNGKAVPLSNDHKPDRPDELSRIEAAGGRVLYWDGARVCGVLAMSRAIGDNHLKPYVTCEPEVTITERSSNDDLLILASDGLWDVVSNDTACGLARMCLKGNRPSAKMKSQAISDESEYDNCDPTCSNASLLLTKLALARRSADNVSVVVIDLRKTCDIRDNFSISPDK